VVHLHAKPPPVCEAWSCFFNAFSMTTPDSQQSLKDEIVDLERRLQDAKSRLNARDGLATSQQYASDAGTLSAHDSGLRPF
jgi:hypothetical protein